MARTRATWLEWFALIVKAADLERRGLLVEARRLLAQASQVRATLEKSGK